MALLLWHIMKCNNNNNNNDKNNNNDNTDNNNNNKITVAILVLVSLEEFQSSVMYCIVLNNVLLWHCFLYDEVNKLAFHKLL